MNEFRHAARQLYNSPWFTVTVVLTLALGIGANTAAFSVMNAVLLKGMPVPNPQELVYLHVPSGQPDGAGNTGNSTTSFSEPVFEDLREDHHAFADLMAFVPLAIGKVAVRVGDTPEEVEGDGKLTSSASLVESRTTRAQERLPRRRAFSEAARIAGASPEFCTRWRAASVAHTHAHEV